MEGIKTSLIDKSRNTDNYSDKVIPSWNDLNDIYSQKWKQEKEKFQSQLKSNFFGAVERFASGKQEIFVLTVSEIREKRYINAFLEIFETNILNNPFPIGNLKQFDSKKIVDYHPQRIGYVVDIGIPNKKFK